MPIGSQNKSIVKALIETIKVKIEPPKLYDALRKMDDDLNRVYETLFEGPLPRVDGSALDLTQIPKTNLPSDIAYIDVANIFTLDQTIQGEGLSLLLQSYDPITDVLGDKYTRISHPVDGHSLLSSNLSYDGTNYDTDDGDGAGLEIVDDIITLRQRISDVDYTPFIIGHDRIIRVGEPVFYTDASAGDMVLANGLVIRGSDSTGLLTLPILELDANDLVVLGSNPTGATTGEGNISIPRAVDTDLPTAGATRNGILIIDKTSDLLCYYVNGARYALTGVAF